MCTFVSCPGYVFDLFPECSLDRARRFHWDRSHFPPLRKSYDDCVGVPCMLCAWKFPTVVYVVNHTLLHIIVCVEGSSRVVC